MIRNLLWRWVNRQHWHSSEGGAVRGLAAVPWELEVETVGEAPPGDWRQHQHQWQQQGCPHGLLLWQAVAAAAKLLQRLEVAADSSRWWCWQGDISEEGGRSGSLDKAVTAWPGSRTKDSLLHSGAGDVWLQGERGFSMGPSINVSELGPAVKRWLLESGDSYVSGSGAGGGEAVVEEWRC
eukprot:g31856.t1